MQMFVSAGQRAYGARRMARIGPVLTFGRKPVNKAELVEALAARLGDRKTATAALDAVISEVQTAVTKGDRVAITGFGVFEKRARNARTARNPRTGEPVKVKKTSVPAFKPGTGFREMVASGKVAKATAAKKTTAAAKSTATKAAPAKSTATKAAPVKAATKTAAAKAGATKATTAKATTAKAAPAKKTATKSAATKSAATKAAPAKTATKTAATK